MKKGTRPCSVVFKKSEVLHNNIAISNLVLVHYKHDSNSKFCEFNKKNPFFDGPRWTDHI